MVEKTNQTNVVFIFFEPKRKKIKKFNNLSKRFWPTAALSLSGTLIFVTPE